MKLKAEEARLYAEIEELVGQARDRFSKSDIGFDLRKIISDAGKKAHELHMLLKSRGKEPKHHAYMIKNREMEADHPDFYLHYHPLEDLIAFIKNPRANDDPLDRTLNETFTFTVYSRRWGHDDTYTMKRTSEGWHVNHLMISGPCDKGGQPFLFRNFDQDSINYPSGLRYNLEVLWMRASEDGLSKEKVQVALNQLAAWVSKTEKSTPTKGIWRGV